MKKIFFILITIVAITAKAQTPIGQAYSGFEGSYNVMTFTYDGGISKGLKIVTKIPFYSTNATTVTIKGFSLQDYAALNLQLGWFNSGGGYEYYSASSAGNLYQQVMLGEQNGFTVIYLDGYCAMPRFEVRAFAIGLGEDPSWYTDWYIEDDNSFNAHADVQIINKVGTLLANYVNTYNLDATNIGAGKGIFTNSVDVGLLNVSYGNIGINVPTSKSKLHIKTNASFPNAINSNSNAYNAVNKSNIFLEGSNNAMVMGVDNGFNTRKAWIQVGHNDVNYAASSVSSTLMLNPLGGLVTIGDIVSTGTTHVSYKLLVDGTIGTRKIKVTQSSTWADYVFNKNYKLKSINQLEEFIKQNKHLPNIPSTNEVTKNGYDLNEMDSKLLEKIEELTLYIIAQNKEIQELKKQVSTLQKKAN